MGFLAEILLMVACAVVSTLFEGIAGAVGPTSPPSNPLERTEHVNGYRRRDGTWVRSYCRRPPHR